ncbi:deaminase [Legionella genomosp. 1]|uniref:deaminase n=1 Tax=Legionella genomosp. 1 TaxID=1093625 RepID=UPI0010548576|nr:deaminase [Legionella genomosp. 1]
MDRSEQTQVELVIGLVAPLGTNRGHLVDFLKKYFQSRGYRVEYISLTKEFIKISPTDVCEAFVYFFKMQLCNYIRERYSSGFFGFLTTYLIFKKRQRNSKTVYLIDQIKNTTEQDVLTHVYGRNYIQISLFSNEVERDKLLKYKFSNDFPIQEESESFTLEIDPNHEYDDLFDSHLIDDIKKLSKKIPSVFSTEIQPDVTHNLIKKDFNDPKSQKGYGQEVSKLFHKSHYFFNLDLPLNKVDHEIKKFVKIVCGEYIDYPTQDEFGMNLAYQVSVRSNFPGDRHIGASILTEQGEVIAVASIRAPSQSSNPTFGDQCLITEGYEIYKIKIEKWVKYLKELEPNQNVNEISSFLKDSLDFHPCTHAEIAAIIDAAKVGISVRNCTLYTTTFPCHLCAKEIVNSGIKRVVYLEAYPKSKNKELYPNVIDFDPKNKSKLLPFDFYYGVGPPNFVSSYSLINKNVNDNFPPLLIYEHRKYYLSREKDVIKYFINKIKGRKQGNIRFLSKLFQDKETSNDNDF